MFNTFICICLPDSRGQRCEFIQQQPSTTIATTAAPTSIVSSILSVDTITTLANALLSLIKIWFLAFILYANLFIAKRQFFHC